MKARPTAQGARREVKAEKDRIYCKRYKPFPFQRVFPISPFILNHLILMPFALNRAPCAVHREPPPIVFTLTVYLASAKINAVLLRRAAAFVCSIFWETSSPFQVTGLRYLDMEDSLGMKLLLCLLGLVLFVEGLPYFLSPGKMKKWMLAVQEIPDSNLRAMGLFAMALGLLIAYFFKE